MPTEKNESRSSVIKAISTPIQLAALIVLVVEGLLLYILTKAGNANSTLYVTLMVGVLVITIVAVFVIEFKRIKLKESDTIPNTGEVESAKKHYTWDVFLAAPLAALSDESFESDLLKMKEIKTILEEDCDFKHVYFAGANMKTKQDFETADVSVEVDVNALKESQNFVLIYPEKIVSSVLFEAGIALALGKPSFYFGGTDNFPFLMKQANQKFNFVKIQDANNLDKIISILRKNKKHLFKI